MTIAGTTPFGRNFYRLLYVLTFALLAGLITSSAAVATHMPGHETGGGKGNNPPVIEDQLFSLNENEPSGSLAGQVVATSIKKNNTLEYQIVGGNNAGLFQLDLLTGELTTASPLNFEAASFHELMVQVTDKFGRSSTGFVIVMVDDVNEAPTASVCDVRGDHAIACRNNRWYSSGERSRYFRPLQHTDL
ncbi:MAG: cadherin repeat domain-containing protein [Alphaproteobacteria bacterium]|nr:cadherin repeat domain-containing protein [Alphaproteobacteria bacterium]